MKKSTAPGPVCAKFTAALCDTRWRAGPHSQADQVFPNAAIRIAKSKLDQMSIERGEGHIAGDLMNQQESGRARRAVGRRQLVMVAMGGAIGTGLFYARGSAIAQAGPGGALFAYAAMGIAVYCMMQSLGEMATHLPIPGSFEAYAERFLDPSWGFAFGWNYWFSWAITLAAEFVAGTLIVQFWFPHTCATLWAVGFLVLLLDLNLLSVKVYAESEYWFSATNVPTVLFFIVVCTL